MRRGVSGIDSCLFWPDCLFLLSLFLYESGFWVRRDGNGNERRGRDGLKWESDLCSIIITCRGMN